MNNTGVSIVICTYNGASKLPETIKHIVNQKVPSHIPWEFVIVDNASADDTVAVAQKEWNNYSCTAEFRIVYEANPGLSYARSKGFASARYEYVILCDDDNWLDPDYIKLVYEIMDAKKNIGALGGNGELIFEEEPPTWIKAFSVYAAGPQAENSGVVKRNILYGAGCAIRKSAYDAIHEAGFRSLLTDRLGKELSSGGDYELCYGLAMAGFDIWYDERLIFKHFITKDRLTEEYYLKYLKESSKCFEVLEPYKIICEKKFLTFRNFRYKMTKVTFYYVRMYIRLNVIKAFYKRESVQHTILSLQLYSIYAKISVFLKNRKVILENYKQGKVLQQKFSKSAIQKILSSTHSSFLSTTKIL